MQDATSDSDRDKMVQGYEGEVQSSKEDDVKYGQ